MSHKPDWGPNPNANCLAGRRCQVCGNAGPIIMEVSGVVEGTTWPRRFHVVMHDDGFAEPLCIGHTEWPADQNCICPVCQFEGELKDFTDPPLAVVR